MKKDEFENIFNNVVDKAMDESHSKMEELTSHVSEYSEVDFLANISQIRFETEMKTIHDVLSKALVDKD